MHALSIRPKIIFFYNLNFILFQILGKDHATAFYSYMDELPSFDSELYRNLTYIKHYEGDVSDLDLTFSFDQVCIYFPNCYFGRQTTLFSFMKRF